MNWDSLSRLGIVLSVFWLILCIVRIGLYSSMFMYTPQGELFVTVLNILLIGGIILIAFVVGKSFLRYTAAKTMKSTHCQQCYAKLEPGAEFCPRCGKRQGEE